MDFYLIIFPFSYRQWSSSQSTAAADFSPNGPHELYAAHRVKNGEKVQTTSIYAQYVRLSR